MSYAGDPSAPAGRATIIETVRNKNNKEEVRLRRRLTEYSKELAMKIVQIDHDRLDAFDFLRQLRMCESDYMAEFAAFREEKAKLSALMERRDTVSTFSDDTLSESPSNPLDEKATSNEHTTVEQTGPAATNTKRQVTNPEEETSGAPAGPTRELTFVRMVFGRGRPSFLVQPMGGRGSGLSPVQQKILHIQQEALLNNKDEKQRAAIMQSRAAAAEHSHGGRAAREAARRQRQRLRKPITRRLRDFYDRVGDLVANENDVELKPAGETAAVTPAVLPVIVVPHTA